MTNWQVIEIQTLRFACKSRLQSADSMHDTPRAVITTAP